MREVFGDKVRLKVVPIAPGGLLGRLRRNPGAMSAAVLGDQAFTLGDDLVSAVETRLLWSRFGL